ncbi:MAG TPA: alpha-ketoglutarate-dependent dioxygenase AlkB [Pseudolabrys sp.]|nr:alpha-ketoglutarate-dependent dioxygenase AlkB [Pseudolabrys sp.]
MKILADASTAQADLFRPSGVPEGFAYRPEIVSAAEESALAQEIAALPLEAFRFQGFLAKRRVMSFGWRYDFDRARFEETDPIPDFLVPLKTRAAEFAGLGADAIAHALVTEYAPGTPIGWHRDRPVFEDVIGVSLLSPCTFRFRRKAGTKWQRHAITAEPRSIYLMRGPSRWDWEHSIPEVEETRYSVTFRTLRKGD